MKCQDGRDDYNEFLREESDSYFCFLSNENCVRGPIEGSSLSDNEAGEMDEDAIDTNVTAEDCMNEDATDDDAIDENLIDEESMDKTDID